MHNFGEGIKPFAVRFAREKGLNVNAQARRATMTDYRYIAKRLLKENRPKELKEMKQDGTLEAFLEEIQKDYSERDLEAVHRTIKGLPPKLRYQERVQTAETAKREIREFLIDGLRAFLSPELDEEVLSEQQEMERQERVRLTLGYD